jgi:hypothetical protein
MGYYESDATRNPVVMQLNNANLRANRIILLTAYPLKHIIAAL